MTKGTHKGWAAVALLLHSILVPFSSLRAAMSMEEEFLFGDIPTVTVASGRADSFVLAPTNVTVITAQEIKERGYRDLKDLLRDLANVDVSYDRDEWVWNMRGVTADNQKRFMHLVDGHSLSSRGAHMSGQMMDLPADLSNVKQVEIVRGPGAVFWGPMAMAGIVNVVTKDAADLPKDTNIAYTYGTQHTQKVDFQLAGRGDTSSNVISGTLYRSAGRDSFTDASTKFAVMDSQSPTFTAGNDPVGRFTTGLDKTHPSYKLQAKGKAGHTFYNAMGFFNDEHNRQYEVNKGRDLRQTRHHWFLELGQDRPVFGNGELLFKVSADLMSQRYEVLKATYVPTGGTAVGNEGEWNRLYSLTVDLRKPFLDGRLETRVGFQDFLRNAFNHGTITSSTTFVTNGVQGDRITTASRSRKVEDYGFYGQISGTPTDSLHLTAGGRLDFNGDITRDRSSASKKVFLPRLAAVWAFSPTSTFKLLYNTGFFRPEAANVSFLSPEKVKQYEIIHMQKAGNFDILTTLYRQRYEDITNLSGTGANIQVGREIAQGVEMEIKAKMGMHRAWFSGHYGTAVLDGIPANFVANINNLDSQRITPEGNKLAYPQWGIAGGATLWMGSKVFVSPSLRVRGPMAVRTRPPSASSIRDAAYEHQSPKTYVNLNLGWDTTENLGFSLYGNNVFNNRTGYPHAIRNGVYQPYGRYVEGRMSLKW